MIPFNTHSYTNSTNVLHRYLLKTAMFAVLDLVSPALLDATHLNRSDHSNSFTTSFLLLLLLIFVHCLPLKSLLSHRNVIGSSPLASQSRVMLVFMFTNLLLGWVVILGGPVIITPSYSINKLAHAIKDIPTYHKWLK